MLNLSPDQQAAVDLVLASRVAVLTGGPGTGKTTVARRIIDSIVDVDGIGYSDIALCAPTGKAAKRLSEQTGLEARTIHRTLGFVPCGNGSFAHDRHNPLPQRLILCDESSMVDVELCASLLAAVAPGSRLLLVGDADQLPSVGPGAVFRDVIASGVIPVARLTTLHRQDPRSYIAANARAVLNGELPTLADDSKDFWFYDTGEDAEAAAEKIRALCIESPTLQVLAPQRKSVVGVDALNEQLREVLNPPDRAGEKVWDLGDAKLGKLRRLDRVIQIRNDYKIGVMNGEIGTVADLDDRQAQVDLGDRVATYTKAQAKTGLRLAYAVTIHKSQGSEYDGVAIPVHTANAFMLSRALLYTAITRGKKQVHLVGNRKALRMAVRKVGDAKRYTGLQGLLRGAAQ
jgi:exodeoxyribonuclease V alpha subunit